ncbi:MAG: ABC transporter permease [Christensenellaceae bacterium]|nr:ABC transporter permease [Christensenellaceae bacterium]MEA5065941.1 ABC transporter permease [Eubacteriales bacterium]MEA5069784.1 ABC transporter permease [Christensenellaceae bacterium]
MQKEGFRTFARKNMVVIFLVLLFMGFGIGTSDVFKTGNVMGIFSSSIFFSANNLVNLTTQMAINAVLSAGLTYVIILGGIDISVGSVAALAGVVSMLFAQQLPDVSTPVAVLVLLGSAILVGAVCGSFNGLMITYFNVVPMIATLAMLTIARGLSFVFSGGSSVFGVSSVYSWLGGARFWVTADKPTGWIPTITLVVIAAVFVVHTLLSSTVFGRHIYATGSNRSVAHLGGVNTKKVIFISHIICSIMAALGGVLNASKLQNGQPAACDGYEMYAIAATVLGGTSLSGGRGSVGRAMFGVAIIAVINNGMNLMHINSYWQKVVIGAIILLAVILDMAQNRKKE